MLKIRRTANGEVVFTVSVEWTQKHVGKNVSVGSEWSSRDLGVKRLTVANQDPINSLERCETDGITPKNCPAYIREWIMSQKSTLAKPVRVRRNNSDKPKD